MRRMPRWREFPLLYRLLLIFFLGLGIIALVVVVAGLRPWIHAAETWALVAFFLLILRGFFPFAYPPGVAPSRPLLPGGFVMVVGALVLFLSGWGLAGAVDEALRGIFPEDILEGVVFLVGSFGAGALALRSGWKRRRGIWGERRPPAAVPEGILNYGERRMRLVSFLAIFILGLAVLYAFNFFGGALGFQPAGWVVIPAGAAVVAAIVATNRSLMRRGRICFSCGERVPPGAGTCPSCGHPFV